MTSSDQVLDAITDYVFWDTEFSDEAVQTARWCLLDSLGCALLSLDYADCRKMLGPVVPSATVNNGARVPGTSHALDPVQAAFNIGTMIRWLDYNDTWLAAEWGHPSDNLGAILAASDWVARTMRKDVTLSDIYRAMIQAHEIQGVLALENSFNRVGLDHVLLVRVASTAVATRILGGSAEQVRNALSHSWLDGGALRTYRHAPNTGSRKSWAAGDATSRAVRLALWSLRGEMGYATPLGAERWGFEDVLFKGNSIVLSQSLEDYVMRHVLFKVSFPAEFHGQTAVEAAFQLAPVVAEKWDDIQQIRIETQEPAVRIIAKDGPLHNPADRDHCLQYMVAIGLLHGALTADHYEDEAAEDPRIDELRKKMVVVEHSGYSADYLDPEKRSIANAIQIVWADGSESERVEVEYPLGHRRRRDEARGPLAEKFRFNARNQLTSAAIEQLLDVVESSTDDMSLAEWLELTIP